VTWTPPYYQGILLSPELFEKSQSRNQNRNGKIKIFKLFWEERVDRSQKGGYHDEPDKGKYKGKNDRDKDHSRAGFLSGSPRENVAAGGRDL
jgi:hypothetical protein